MHLKLSVIKCRVPDGFESTTCAWNLRLAMIYDLMQPGKHSGAAGLTLGFRGVAPQLRAEMDALQRALQADGRAPLAQTALIEAQLAALSAKHEDVLAQAHPRHLPCLVLQSLVLSGPNTEDVLAQVRRL